MDSDHIERSWQSPDGLTLFFRDYPGDGGDKLPVLCLHGLTRNSRDFELLAPHIAAQGHRVLALDMRGRGNSDYAKDSMTYQLPTYIGDVMALLEQEGIDRFISIGTSMGGLMTMVLGGLMPDRVAGALLNDIGPEVETGGIDKIKTYLGQGRSFPSWMHAARALEEVHGEAHPAFDTDGWLSMAKRCMIVCSNGRIAFDYDMKLAEPFVAADETTVPPDLWPSFDALASKPMVIVRGGLSNLLSQATLAEMLRRAPKAVAVTVPDAGHAPTLDEPEVRAAIDSMLAKVG